MKSTTVAALAAVLSSSGALAVPMAGHAHAAAHGRLHHKRDVVWVTEWEIDVVTQYETVYADGSRPTGVHGDHTMHTPAAVTVTSHDAPASSSSSSQTQQAADTTSTAAVATAASTTSSVPAPTTTSSTTSVYVAPAPVTTSAASSDVEVAPTTTSSSSSSSASASSSSSSAAAAAPAATSAVAKSSSTYAGAGSTSAGATYSGDFTYWEPALGACGITNNESQPVVAISHTLFDPSTPNGNPNNNPLCGRTVNLVGKDGNTYSATVVDRCVGCAEGDLDLTQTLFNTVTSNGDGRVSNMQWSWT